MGATVRPLSVADEYACPMPARSFPRPRRERSSLAKPELIAELSKVFGVPADQLQRINIRTLQALDAKTLALTVDGLTGAMLRGPGFERLGDEIVAARARDQPLSVVYLDIDGLKNVNDEFGHAAGDRLVRGVIDTMGVLGVPRDRLVRLGGDEFLAILPNSTAADARQLRSRLADRLTGDGSSVSSGSAQLSVYDTVDRLVARADRGQQAEKQTRSSSRGHCPRAAPALPEL